MWLSKLFDLRDKASRSRGTMADDDEKPFLSHLEDLRTMVVRVVATLLVSTVVCFIYNAQLVELILGPAKTAGIYTEVSLPDTVTSEHWEQIRKLNKAAVPLTSEQRSLLLDAAFADSDRWEKDSDLETFKTLREVADVHYIYLASEQLTGATRSKFLNDALNAEPELLAQAMKLLDAGTPADLDGEVSAITMQALGVTETFKLSIKLSLFAGIVVSFPLLFYFIAQFVFPGLTSREKKMLWPSLTIGFGLFLVGVLFAYYFVTVEALKFFHGFSKDMGVMDQWKIGEYVSFTTQLILIFGLSFELPVVVMALVKLDLLTHEFMRQTRSYAIVIILVIAAIITPTPDAIVLSALACPMIILYEICIWLSWFMKRKERKEEEAEEAKRKARVTPAAGALPISALPDASGSSTAQEEEARPYEQADDSAHYPADHDPYHDDDHHGQGNPDYDPYQDGYYDDYYRDDSANADENKEDSGATDKQESAPEADQPEVNEDPTAHVDVPEVKADDDDKSESGTETEKGEPKDPDDKQG
ncbi:MAG: sec-independent protein translocase protein TatC [Verrucomicrobiales bacterium]|jgi:sec-independent protein translocase protein TatC